ncbi:MAG: hypothetical protein EOM87_00210 [Clostridia bacterium]|nr:hypothetical protein [Clostridia bacterium]
MNWAKNIKTAILIILCLTLILDGCCKEYGFKTNFCYPTTDNHTKASSNELVCDVVSNKSLFDISQVTMDFYFGYLTAYSYGFSEEEYESEYTENKFTTHYFQCIALYFQRIVPDQEAFFSGTLIYDNYQNIENTFIVKEFTYDDFYNEDYGVTETKKLYKRELTYSHYESFTIPSEIFVGEKGYFAFVVRAVYQDQSSEKYFLSRAGLLKMYYKFIDENVVELLLSELQ